MPTKPEFGQARAFEDGSVWLANRVRGNDGNFITQASLTAITCSVFDPAGVVVTTPAVVVASAVFDALQLNANDARWPIEETTGFNFAHLILPADLPEGGKVYRVEFVLDAVSGPDFHLVWDVTTTKLRTS